MQQTRLFTPSKGRHKSPALAKFWATIGVCLFLMGHPYQPVSGQTSFANDPRVILNLVPENVLRGGDTFFRETFEGNGRSCGTCHPPENNLTIDPDFVQTLRDADLEDGVLTEPLLVAERLHMNRVRGLEKPGLMRRFGLILENVDGFFDPDDPNDPPSFVGGERFMMRSVPHVLSMSTSITATDTRVRRADGTLPDGTNLGFVERTGWSGDGVSPPGTLRRFLEGAVIQHYTRTFEDRNPDDTGTTNFRLPMPEELDDVAAFLMETGRLNDLDLASVTLTDPRAEKGRVLFTTGMGGAKCFGCHNNAGANSAFPDNNNRNFNTGIETVRPDRLDGMGIPEDGGFGGQLAGHVDENGQPVDDNMDGIRDGLGNGTFNIPPLVEAADTGPFFHTNAFRTIEQAVGFYSTTTFDNSPGGQTVRSVFGEGIGLSLQETRQVAAFLRVINASFNLAIGQQRIRAARKIEKEFPHHELVNQLLELANAELDDALGVLQDRNLNPETHATIEAAIESSRLAIGSDNTRTRLKAMKSAFRSARTARGSLGTGVQFKMGSGNLVF